MLTPPLPQALGESNLAMVALAESQGAAAKFTGSGGAVFALCPGGQSQADELREACSAKGLILTKVEVGGPSHWRWD